AGHGIALEEDHAAHFDVADEPPDLLVAFDGGAAEPHQQEITYRRTWMLGRGQRGARRRQRADQRGGDERTEPHQPRDARAASTSRVTRRRSTGLVTMPSRLSEGPTISPSATEGRSAAVSAVAPEPTRRGTSGTAPRTRFRSLIGVGSPVATPDTTRPSASARATQSSASYSIGVGCSGIPCLTCTSARILMSRSSSRR